LVVIGATAFWTRGGQVGAAWAGHLPLILVRNVTSWPIMGKYYLNKIIGVHAPCSSPQSLYLW